MKKYNIVFCGTPDFSIPTLDMLFNHPQINILHVITMPDRKSGRGQQLSPPPVALFAKQNKIPLFQTANINSETLFLEQIEKEPIDFIIVLAFAQFLKKRVLNIAKLGNYNIHTSLLPKHRGAAPIQYALLAGDTTTGVTIQKISKKMDQGDILLKKEIPILPNENLSKLYTKLKFQSAISTCNFIDDFNSLVAEPQDHTKATYAPSLKKDDGKITFASLTINEFTNKYKGLYGWPGIFCFINNKRLKVLDFTVDKSKLTAGQLSVEYGALIVGLKDGSIRLTKVQLEGKKINSDTELINFFKNKNETITFTT